MRGIAQESITVADLYAAREVNLSYLTSICSQI